MRSAFGFLATATLVFGVLSVSACAAKKPTESGRGSTTPRGLSAPKGASSSAEPGEAAPGAIGNTDVGADPEEGDQNLSD